MNSNFVWKEINGGNLPTAYVCQLPLDYYAVIRKLPKGYRWRIILDNHVIASKATATLSEAKSTCEAEGACMIDAEFKYYAEQYMQWTGKTE